MGRKQLLAALKKDEEDEANLKELVRCADALCALLEKLQDGQASVDEFLAAVQPYKEVRQKVRLAP